MPAPYSLPSALMTPEDEVFNFDVSESAAQQQQQQQQEMLESAERDCFISEELDASPLQHTGEPAEEGNREGSGWAFTDEGSAQADNSLAADRENEVQQQQQQQQQQQRQPQQQEQQQRFLWDKCSKEEAAASKVTSTARFILKMQAFLSCILSGRSKSLIADVDKSVKKDGEVPPEKQHDVVMAFHQRGQASELLQYHFTILLLAVSVAFGTQNALAPNLSRIAETFHFTDAERDIRVGGELAGNDEQLLGYAIKRIGPYILCFVFLAGLASLCTFFVNAYWQLALLRLAAGLASGGVHPLAYSWVGDWFRPSLRSCASALVLGAAGFGTFCGQCLAALLGALDWRWVFLILAAPLLFMAQFYYIANGRLNEPLSHFFGEEPESRGLAFSSLKAMARSKTNLLMLVQAFPGNVPWGVLVVYLHDFLRMDVGLSDSVAIAAIMAVAAASFCGMIVGGMIGGQLYAHSGRRLLRFCACTCVLRCIPCVMIFAFPSVVGKAPEGLALLGLLALLLGAAFGSTLPTANIGAVLLNVNTAEVRGTICAIYTVLDDISKALGTVVASVLAALVGSRAVAFQLSMSLWLLSAVALFAASNTYAADEARAAEAESRRAGSGFRCLADEGTHDRMPLILRQQQQQALQQRNPGVGECSCCCSPRETLKHSSSINSCSTSCSINNTCYEQPGSGLRHANHNFCASETTNNLWEQIEEDGGYSRHLSRL
ncbi:hypothetical protein, conserved [Eimeria praecox]|uniref:Major facilitator superfamily (MFS) profile domain-containing protein n=1 Tax=Eimeria praecox TaxID=51316 RepID=U6GWE9_9EIME|nr:hypothetical protein, conserved [Eimeria praecox]